MQKQSERNLSEREREREKAQRHPVTAASRVAALYGLDVPLALFSETFFKDRRERCDDRTSRVARNLEFVSPCILARNGNDRGSRRRILRRASMTVSRVTRS